MKLVEGWQNFWKWNSVQIFALLGALPLVWMELPADVKAMVPVEWRPWIFLGLAAAGVLARLRDQGLPK